MNIQYILYTNDMTPYCYRIMETFVSNKWATLSEDETFFLVYEAKWAKFPGGSVGDSVSIKTQLFTIKNLLHDIEKEVIYVFLKIQ
jgi:hypothetical protein